MEQFMAGRTSRLLALLAVAASSMVAAGPAGVWLNVPFVPQPRNGCGAASIAMVMRYWSAHGSAIEAASADVVAIDRELYSPQQHGITARAMEDYFRRAGFRTFAFTGRWSDLGDQLARGRPLIVCLRESRAAPLHYVVVVGVDSERSLILINDPAGRKLEKLDRRSFEKGWRASGNWTLLAIPQTRH
jgi:ABC-type bacteriocin/lantibiotic exporter with double-glycine peptidase domain